MALPTASPISPDPRIAAATASPLTNLPTTARSVWFDVATGRFVFVDQPNVATAIGATGGVGPQGEPGPQGIQGIQGPQGIPGLGGAAAFTPFTRDLGVAQRSGVFDVTGLLGLTADKPVMVIQTAAPIASKGDARDEPEMDQIRATGYVVNATTLRVYWQAPSVVVGVYGFAYLISA